MKDYINLPMGWTIRPSFGWRLVIGIGWTEEVLLGTRLRLLTIWMGPFCVAISHYPLPQCS